ncbi:hypothetical protein AB1N83_013942, partial [Pleurotus pulmonarius]
TYHHHHSLAGVYQASYHL